MGNVFTDIGEGGRVFRNEDVLSPEFLPGRLPGREKQEEEIASCLKPATLGNAPINLFVHGNSGTGKTSTCKLVLKQLSEYSSRPLPIYINCWQNSTRQAILSILSQKVGDVLPRRGLAGDEVFTRIIQQLKREKCVPVIVLDEADKLFFGGEEQVLYDLTRAHETYGVPIGVLLITNSSDLMAKADNRIRGSLSAQEVFFKPYSPQELKTILAERAKLALVTNAWNDEVIALCAAHGAKNGGDARSSLKALWNGAKNAERRGSESISLDDVRRALEVTTTSAEEKEQRDEKLLGENEQHLLEIVREKKSVSVGELYLEYLGKWGGSERSARNYLRELELRGFVSSEESRGARGERVKTILIK
ncbi:hypothetical protein AUJ14_00925 [Candidatus Micrarchaeota archaeon CG1_02_55_22]|nr:MAG: hypothetical protein AUJ14_00925 [Candidatus Micrarchaeota archaeon CG1_02_55_22]